LHEQICKDFGINAIFTLSKHCLLERIKLLKKSAFTVEMTKKQDVKDSRTTKIVQNMFY